MLRQKARRLCSVPLVRSAVSRYQRRRPRPADTLPPAKRARPLADDVAKIDVCDTDGDSKHEQDRAGHDEVEIFLVKKAHPDLLIRRVRQQGRPAGDEKHNKANRRPHGKCAKR